jgi:hypothetical protein
MGAELFAREQIVGVFRGFREGGLEFHADLALPYRDDFQRIPMHGQFLLVQLEHPDEAVLGRIASLASDGKLSLGPGEEFTLRAVRENRAIPEDLREQYLKYRVTIRVLGVLRRSPQGAFVFVASHRRLPHVGSPVAFPSGEVLREIAGHHTPGAPIGHFALGEYIYTGADPAYPAQEWMQLIAPEIVVKFPVESLVARRSFIFARAGFGKSNLNKLLFSQLYARTPTVEKRGGQRVPVGTIIFDPDGEYCWPDDKGRPGLCDVPALEDKLVAFTGRAGPSAFYQSFVAGKVKLDIRRLKPSDVIAICLSPERQEQQNVRKLAGLSREKWRSLVDLIARDGNAAPIKDICELLDLEVRQEVEAYAARGNMTTIVRLLHDKSSQFMDKLLYALGQGKLCVVDLSQMRGGQGMMLAGLVLRHIFDHNQEQFTAAVPKTIPTIAVIEEAQSVLQDEGNISTEPYVAWVKEGRKYDLGALLVTQQPGSIPADILSQGDNWFVFHLLAAADLTSLRKANAHFSEDLLGALLNEPIPGQGVYWSSVGGKPYPVPLRVLSFEHLTTVRDPDYDRPAACTFAAHIKEHFAPSRAEMADGADSSEGGGDIADLDVLALHERRAIEALRGHEALLRRLQADGYPWGSLKMFLTDALPEDLVDRDAIAYRLIPQALTEVLGPRDVGWETYRDKANRLFVRTMRQATTSNPMSKPTV